MTFKYSFSCASRRQIRSWLGNSRGSPPAGALSFGQNRVTSAADRHGASYEGFVIETLLSQAPAHCTPYFCRTSAGAEIDLLLSWDTAVLWAIEIKRSLDPRPRRGFHHARQDLQPTRSFVAYPGKERYRISEDVEAIPIASWRRKLRGLGRTQTE